VMKWEVVCLYIKPLDFLGMRKAANSPTITANASMIRVPVSFPFVLYKISDNLVSYPIRHYLTKLERCTP
jgi:hypothetical protein